jgi:hypothetical protein
MLILTNVINITRPLFVRVALWKELPLSRHLMTPVMIKRFV